MVISNFPNFGQLHVKTRFTIRSFWWVTKLRFIITWWYLIYSWPSKIGDFDSFNIFTSSVLQFVHYWRLRGVGEKVDDSSKVDGPSESGCILAKTERFLVAPSTFFVTNITLIKFLLTYEIQKWKSSRKRKRMTKKISQSLSVGYHFRTGYRKFRSETSLVEMTTGQPYWSANGNDIDNHSKSLGRTGQFLVTAFGILFFFIVYGYLQGQGSPDFDHPMTVIGWPSPSKYGQHHWIVRRFLERKIIFIWWF